MSSVLTFNIGVDGENLTAEWVCIPRPRWKDLVSKRPAAEAAAQAVVAVDPRRAAGLRPKRGICPQHRHSISVMMVRKVNWSEFTVQGGQTGNAVNVEARNRSPGDAAEPRC